MPEGFAAEFRTVHQALDLNADVDKDAEVGDIMHRALDDAAWLQFGQLDYLLTRERQRYVFPGIAARLG